MKIIFKKKIEVDVCNIKGNIIGQLDFKKDDEADTYQIKDLAPFDSEGLLKVWDINFIEHYFIISKTLVEIKL